MPTTPYKLSFDLPLTPVGNQYRIVRLIEGIEELSALYSYEFQVRTPHPDNCAQARALLGRRTTITISPEGEPDTQLQAIHGIIMSVASSTAEASDEQFDSEMAWYRWVIRPEFAKACYSRNRLVYNAAELDASGAAPGVKLLEAIAARWNTPIAISSKAKERMPKFIQLVQNDESDYNFFTRVLASWGLGYRWGVQEGRECLQVLDMIGEDREFLKPKDGEEQPFTAMAPISPQCLFWQANYGVQDLDAAQVKVEDYHRPAKDANARLSLHDESWDQLDTKASAKPSADFTVPQDNALQCHGRYAYDGSSEDWRQLALGGKARWAGTNPQYDDTVFCLTRLVYTAADASWSVRMEGRCPAKGCGMGVLPRPVQLNNSPDTLSGALIAGEAWPAPRLRPFMAIVEDESLWEPSDASKGRNFCKVREIAACTAATIDKGKVELGNTLWVEMGSPFADADSGLLARPRKGNVLFCLDRGDMSIPLALSSFYRHGNDMPRPLLKQREGGKLTPDLNIVTLRNRSMDSQGSTTVTRLTPESESRVIDEFSVPRSVHKLLHDKPKCSQIQLVGKENGVSPIDKDAKNLSKKISAACAAETGICLLSGLNQANAMAGRLSYLDDGDELATPANRAHFQGINISSEKDLLQQSVDSQFINAGGIINITSAAGITLRVGRNCISITENGIEMTGGMGRVSNPGAHAAYNGEGQEAVHVAGSFSGALSLNQTGAKLGGTNIKVSAVNNARLEVSLGSIVELSNYDCNISSPHTTVIGGASIGNTLTYGISSFGTELADVISSQTDSNDSQGHQKRADRASAGTTAVLDAGAALSNIKGVLTHFTNLISVTGSMVELDPYYLLLSSTKTYNEAANNTLYANPAAGFRALGQNGVLGAAMAALNPAWLSRLSTSMSDNTVIGRSEQTLNRDTAEFSNNGVVVTRDSARVKNQTVAAQTSINALSQDIESLKTNKAHVTAALTAAKNAIVTVKTEAVTSDQDFTAAKNALTDALTNITGPVAAN